MSAFKRLSASLPWPSSKAAVSPGSEQRPLHDGEGAAWTGGSHAAPQPGFRTHQANPARPDMSMRTSWDQSMAPPPLLTSSTSQALARGAHATRTAKHRQRGSRLPQVTLEKTNRHDSFGAETPPLHSERPGSRSFFRRHRVTLSRLSSSSTASEWARQVNTEHARLLPSVTRCEAKIENVAHEQQQLADIQERIERVSARVEEYEAGGENASEESRTLISRPAPVMRKQKGHRIDRSSTSRLSLFTTNVAPSGRPEPRHPRRQDSEASTLYEGTTPWNRYQGLHSRRQESRGHWRGTSSLSSLDSSTAFQEPQTALAQPVAFAMPTLQHVQSPAKANGLKRASSQTLAASDRSLRPSRRSVGMPPHTRSESRCQRVKPPAPHAFVYPPAPPPINFSRPTPELTSWSAVPAGHAGDYNESLPPWPYPESSMQTQAEGLEGIQSSQAPVDRLAAVASDALLLHQADEPPHHSQISALANSKRLSTNKGKDDQDRGSLNPISRALKRCFKPKVGAEPVTTSVQTLPRSRLGKCLASLFTSRAKGSRKGAKSGPSALPCNESEMIAAGRPFAPQLPGSQTPISDVEAGTLLAPPPSARDDAVLPPGERLRQAWHNPQGSEQLALRHRDNDRINPWLASSPSDGEVGTRGSVSSIAETDAFSFRSWSESLPSPMTPGTPYTRSRHVSVAESADMPHPQSQYPAGISPNMSRKRSVVAQCQVMGIAGGEIYM